MTKQELLKRVEELERRVREIESRPMVVYTPAPQPVFPPLPIWQPPYVVTCSA